MVPLFQNTVCVIRDTFEIAETKEFKEMLSDLNFVTECLNEEALKNLPDECKKVHDIICG